MSFVGNVLSGLRNYYNVVHPFHAGSWQVAGIRLPDVGVTEALAAATGAPRNPQTGGSEVKQPQTWSVPAPAPTHTQEVKQHVQNMQTGRAYYTGQELPTNTNPLAKVNALSQPQSTAPSVSIPTTEITSDKFSSVASQIGAPKDLPSGRYGHYEVVDTGHGTRIIRDISDLIAQQEAAARQREEQLRSQIESGFNDIFSQLDKMAGLIPQQEQQAEQFVQQSFGNALSGLEKEKEANLQRLGTYKEDIQREAKQRSQEIANNIRNLLYSSQNIVGALGAGASSAANVMLPYALSKQAAKAGSQVASQAVAQLGELHRKELDIGNTFMQAKTQLEQDKISKLSALKQQYEDLKRRIDEAKLTAKGQRLQALINLDQSLYNQAAQKAAQIEAEARQKQNAIEEWARNRLAQLDNVKLQLSRTAQFSPRQLVYNELRGLGSLYAGMGGETGEDILNPLVLLKKRRQQLENL